MTIFYIVLGVVTALIIIALKHTSPDTTKEKLNIALKIVRANNRLLRKMIKEEKL